MNHKNNPWVSLVALLLLALILVLTCTGCRKVAEKAPPRFTEEMIARDLINEKWVYIITDTETGRQYLLYRRVNASGMVELEG